MHENKIYNTAWQNSININGELNQTDSKPIEPIEFNSAVLSSAQV
jgi:hypothetical protein